MLLATAALCVNVAVAAVAYTQETTSPQQQKVNIPAWPADTKNNPHTATSASKTYTPVAESSSVAESVDPSQMQTSAATPDQRIVRTFQVRPFRQWAVSANIGSTGIGFETATPLARHFNLRMGASFFGFTTNIEDSGWHYDLDFKLRSGQAQMDYYPWVGGVGFHISPGISFHQNGGFANIYVPGGQRFDIGDGTYTSSTADPVTGKATFNYDNHVAPMVSIGFGNMIPRNGRHWSIPVEIGGIFTGAPKFGLDVNGSVCTTIQGHFLCDKIANDAQAQSDLVTQRQDVQNTMNDYARVYPVVKVGFAWNFGPRY